MRIVTFPETVVLNIMSGSNAAVEGLSGALGGVLALLSTYPLMTVGTVVALK